MKKETWSILFACALGSFIGAMSALEISTRFAYGQYFWGLGALFGGIVAYIAVDFQQLCAGVARSYRVSIRNISNMHKEIITWRPYLPYWKATGMWMLGFLTLITSIVLFFFAGSFGVEYLSASYNIKVPNIICVFFTVIAEAIIFSMVMITIFVPFGNSKSNWKVHSKGLNYEEFLLADIPGARGIIKYGNPIVLPFMLLTTTIKLIWMTLRWLWQDRVHITNAAISGGLFISDVITEFGRLVRRAFVYIHSERRTICFVDATLGAVTGFFFGSAILGMVIGAILGVINYEIISVRWLKLVPIDKD